VPIETITYVDLTLTPSGETDTEECMSRTYAAEEKQFDDYYGSMSGQAAPSERKQVIRLIKDREFLIDITCSDCSVCPVVNTLRSHGMFNPVVNPLTNALAKAVYYDA